jgi:predicted nucleotidyltransferase
MRQSEDVSVSNLDVDAIVQILEEIPVTHAILYGSHARDDATATSDIDLAVEFEDSLTSGERTQTRVAIIERLCTTLETDDVDVIPLSHAPAELVEEIFRDGILIYGSSEGLERYEQVRSQEHQTHRDRLEEFDDLLAELEQVV